MKVHQVHLSFAPAASGTGSSGAEGVRESGNVRGHDLARLSQSSLGAQASTVTSQPAVRTDRMAAISDDSWISDPPALNTGMLDEIKAAVREGRFVIDERVIARALAEDALR
jgi:anti-sigma28 factor (negative regulator of flagellin synthesis)